MLSVVDLFSGIGGFSLGLERTGGFKTAAFCEINPYSRAVLRKHWPTVPIYEDITTLTGQQLRKDGISVDVLTGGFPCQDISHAGRKAGIDGDRSKLWAEFARLTDETRPAWVIIENSAALHTRGLDVVLRDLADIGYDAEWSGVSACAFHLAHMRRRLLIVAYPTGQWGQQCGRLQFAESSDPARHVHLGVREPQPARVAHGVPHRMDRLASIGNSIVPYIPEMVGGAILRATTARSENDQGRDGDKLKEAELASESCSSGPRPLTVLTEERT